jgi:hypothetical protein
MKALLIEFANWTDENVPIFSKETNEIIVERYLSEHPLSDCPLPNAYTYDQLWIAMCRASEVGFSISENKNKKSVNEKTAIEEFIKIIKKL